MPRRSLAVQPGERGVVALSGARERPRRADGARERPRLACRQELLAGHDRHQFVLDRHRDRQSRPCARLPQLSASARSQRCIDLCRGIVGRHAMPAERVLAHSDVAPGRKVDPGRTVSVAAAGRGGHRSYCRAATSRRHAGSRARRQGRGGRGTAVDAVALRLWRRYHRRIRRSDRRCGCSVSAAFPAAPGRRPGRSIDGRYAAPGCSQALPREPA